ncbi:MAG: imidazole glycerol phosphate synthase subunit HisH [Promethearchaeota archaeon]
MSVGIVDYGMGNLRSIEKALARLGQKPLVSGRLEDLEGCEALVLPGVGAFGDAVANLKRAGLDQYIKDRVEGGTPLLGICLGLQLLLDESEEMGKHAGLGLVPGRVVRFNTKEKVPQIGWNVVEFTEDAAALSEGLPSGTHFYFVHSYHAVLLDPKNGWGWTEYGGVLYASVVATRGGKVVATQFHPEKSGKWGLRLLENYFSNLAD